MKKIYQTPNIKVVVLKSMQIICTSQIGVAGYTNGNVTSSDARQARFSDDDWDEE